MMNTCKHLCTLEKFKIINSKCNKNNTYNDKNKMPKFKFTKIHIEMKYFIVNEPALQLKFIAVK